MIGWILFAALWLFVWWAAATYAVDELQDQPVLRWWVVLAMAIWPWFVILLLRDRARERSQ